jgi:hypothetical protein
MHAAVDAIACMACMCLGKNCVRVDSRGRARPCACRCARARARACVRAFWSVGVRLHAQRVDELCARACASQLHAPSHRTAATCGMNSSARAVRAWLRSQVPRGRAARPARNGLRELPTRRWSTPPAPSTSSAANTAARTTPPSRTCTRARTEVRGPDYVTGDGRWVLAGALRGAKEVLRGYWRGTRGVSTGI